MTAFFVCTLLLIFTLLKLLPEGKGYTRPQHMITVITTHD
jgi:hypothetical protein